VLQALVVFARAATGTLDPVNDGLLNKSQRKKARRKAKRQSERQAHRDLDTVTSDAIEEALRLAPLVAAANLRSDQLQAIDVELASPSEAQFVRKRVWRRTHRARRQATSRTPNTSYCL